MAVFGLVCPFARTGLITNKDLGIAILPYGEMRQREGASLQRVPIPGETAVSSGHHVGSPLKDQPCDQNRNTCWGSIWERAAAS